MVKTKSKDLYVILTLTVHQTNALIGYLFIINPSSSWCLTPSQEHIWLHLTAAMWRNLTSNSPQKWINATKFDPVIELHSNLSQWWSKVNSIWWGADNNKGRDGGNHLGYCNDHRSLAGGSVEQTTTGCSSRLKKAERTIEKEKVKDWRHSFTQRVTRKLTHTSEVLFCHFQTLRITLSERTSHASSQKSHLFFSDRRSCFHVKTFPMIKVHVLQMVNILTNPHVSL